MTYMFLKEFYPLQISKAMNCEFGTSAETTSMQVEISSSSSTNLLPTIYGRQPLVPYVWPPWPISTITRRPCHVHDSPGIFGGPRPHFYLPPCAWFYPSSHEISGSCSQNSHPSKERREDPVSIRHGSKETDLFSPHTIAAEEEENASANKPSVAGKNSNRASDVKASS